MEQTNLLETKMRTVFCEVHVNTIEEVFKTLFEYYTNLLNQYNNGAEIDPLLVNLLITKKCNLNCRHCFNWESNNNTKTKDLDPDELLQIAKSMGQVPIMVVSGGEPFLRDDIDAITGIFVKHNGLRRIGFCTNGFDTDKVTYNLEKVLQTCPEISVGVTFSIDGPKEVHNFIRANPRAFDNAMLTWRQVKELKRKYSHLGMGVACVVNAYNQNCLDALYDLIVNGMQPDDISLLLIRQSPRENGTKQDIVLDNYEQFARKLEQYFLKCRYRDRFTAFSKACHLLTYQVVTQIKRTDTPQVRCMAGTSSVMIDHAGGVYACECREPVAQLREHDYNFRKIFRSAEFKKERAAIQSCYCTHETQGIVPSLAFSAPHLEQLHQMTQMLSESKS